MRLYMNEIILLKCGEMVLKGLNRARFESRLAANIKRRLKKYGDFTVRFAQSTYFIEPGADSDADGAFEAMKLIFGITTLSRARVCEKNMEAIYACIDQNLSGKLAKAKTFKVEAKRADKKFPLTSPEIMREAGSHILEGFPLLKVDVHAPELTVFVEIRDEHAYVHTERVDGAGGLPVGTAGKATLLISGGIDSPVAGYMMAKRGLELNAVHFFSYPYTSVQARRKVETLASLVSDFAGRMTLHCVTFTTIQEAIRDNVPPELFTLVMRRFMMRISQRIALSTDSGALVTGESLGQVASQTMEAIGVTGCVCDIPVFRPLIGMDKEEIVKLSRKIGTFETSILPYEDCCTVFTPRHPSIRPRIERILEAESRLDIAKLEDTAIETMEIIV